MRVPRIAALIVATASISDPSGAETDAGSVQALESVELAPHARPSWSWTHLFAPVSGLLLGGAGYWYDPRSIEIDTDPRGALLDLYYVRHNFQKAYERAEAPVRVLLPSRIEATPGDSVAIRALLDGHRQQEIRVAVRSRTERVKIELAPLPNALVAFNHTYFAGRGSLVFSTREALAFRLQASPQGFWVLLLGTRAEPGVETSLATAASSLIDSVKARQIGEDLVVAVGLTQGGRDASLEPRSRQRWDPVRSLHVSSLDLVPEDGGAADIERAREVLAGMQSAHATGCALEFDAHLRGALDPAALARALAPDGSYRDRFVRAAMKRLGEVSPGEVIRMQDGSRLCGSNPLELTAAATQPGQAIGYLALLRSIVDGLEPERLRRPALRSLLASELAPSRFGAILDAAEQRERACGHRSR